MRSVPGRLALLLVVAACDAGDAPEPLLVDPADTTRTAVVRDLGKLVSDSTARRGGVLERR